MIARILIVAVGISGAVAAGAPQLTAGTMLPSLPAKTLNGAQVALPKDLKGHPALFVIGFSKAAAGATRPWLEACRSAVSPQPVASRVSCYDVRMVADIPWLLRGLVEMSMRSGLPAELQQNVLLVYSDNDAWQQRVSATDLNSAYIVACDKDGHVKGTSKGALVQADLKKLLEQLATEMSIS
jgi:hypothetical protein